MQQQPPGSVNNAAKKGPLARSLQIGKYLLAVVPIVWIFFLIDIEKLKHTFETTAKWTLPVMAALVIVLMFLQGIRWWMLLRAFLPKLSLTEVLSCHFKGIYYSIFLPTSAAQDVVRTVLLSRTCDYGIAWGATWISRILGLIVLLLLSVYGAFNISPAEAPPGMKVLIVLSGVIVAVLGGMSFFKRFTRIFREVFVKILPEKVITTIESIREGVYRYRSKGRAMLSVAGITIIVQMLVVCSYIFLIRGITGRFYFIECFTYIPLIEIICMSIPLTPNGIGVRDALSAMMFHQIGLPTEQLGIYIILSLASTLLKIVGGVPLVYEAFTSLKKRSG